jgi:hypothetical protein
MSDEELASGVWLKDKGITSDGLPFVAASHGWVPELRRMDPNKIIHSPLAHNESLCWLMEAALRGEHDPSPEKRDSWQIALMLRDAGFSTTVCRPLGSVSQRLDNALNKRPAAQFMQW